MSAPDIFDIEAKWPRPYRFIWVLGFSLALFLLFEFGWRLFRESTLIPGILFTGSFAVPISAVVLFAEFNIRKNVPLKDVVLLVLLGGVLSLLLSLCLLHFDYVLFSAMKIPQAWYDSVRAPLEEFAKLVVVFLVARRAQYRYHLNGLLFGAAVGAGFASFESAGYALSYCLNAVVDCVVEGATDGIEILGRGVRVAEGAIISRGILSPFSHVAWSALTCAGLWMAKGDAPLRFSNIVNWRFLLLGGVAVALHMTWNAPFELPYYGKYVILGVVAWGVIFCVVECGVRQIRRKQDAVLNFV